MMLAFLALTIIFSYNQLYINNQTCNPLMLYLGSERACKRTNFENFENESGLENETILEKFAFLFEIVKSPFLNLYSITLAILKSMYKIIIYIHLQFVVYMTYFFIKQDETCDKIKSVFIEPLLIRVTDPLFKIIQMGLNKNTNK